MDEETRKLNEANTLSSLAPKKQNQDLFVPEYVGI
jgi:hypothetical protein